MNCPVCGERMSRRQNADQTVTIVHTCGPSVVAEEGRPVVLNVSELLQDLKVAVDYTEQYSQLMAHEYGSGRPDPTDEEVVFVKKMRSKWGLE